STRLRRGKPHLFSVRYPQGSQPSALRGIRRQSYLNDRTRRGLPHQIRNCRIHQLPVAGHAPLHTSVSAALAYARLPQNLTLAIRVERINDARLLPREQNVMSIRHLLEEHRRSEVVVRPWALPAGAGAAEYIAGCHLFGPHDSTGLQV